MELIRQGLERGMFMTFGEKVRSLRKEKKMSQQELASMVGAETWMTARLSASCVP